MNMLTGTKFKSLNPCNCASNSFLYRPEIKHQIDIWTFSCFGLFGLFLWVRNNQQIMDCKQCVDWNDSNFIPAPVFGTYPPKELVIMT